MLKILLCYLTLVASSFAAQPVLDIAPRDKPGVGMQIRQEYYGSSTLLRGESEVENSQKLKTHMQKTWYEAAFNFTENQRIILRMPHLQLSRVKQSGAEILRQKNSGFGDIELAFAYSSYSQKEQSRSYFALAPQLRLPSASDAVALPLGDGSTDLGFFALFNSDSNMFYQHYELYFGKITKVLERYEKVMKWGPRLSLVIVASIITLAIRECFLWQI